MQIASASFAYPRLRGEARAALAVQLGDRQVPGALVLCTCLRIEVAVAGGRAALADVVGQAFAADPPSDLLALAQVRYDLEAITHLYRVAAGLESPIVGEREILTQFRQATTRQAVLRAGDGPEEGLFQKLLEGAVATGRQVREEILVGSPHGSMAAVAAQAVGAGGRVAVIGAGTMGTVVVEALLNLPAPPEVVVLARHPDKVAIGRAEVWGIERLEEALATFPVVVSVTSAGRLLIDADRLEAILGNRSRPLLLVDLAMPPDFAVPHHASLTYLDIDQLASMAARRASSQEADSYVAAAAAAAYRRVVDHPELGPLIGEMMSEADRVVEATVDRFAGRLSSPSDRDLLNQVAHTVARRLLAGPVSYLKDPDRHPATSEVIAAMFDLE